MLIKYFQWNSILLLFLSLYLIQLVNGNRENLAQRHPCYTVNKLLLPYIKWTEKLASTQYKGKFSMRKEKKEKDFVEIYNGIDPHCGKIILIFDYYIIVAEKKKKKKNGLLIKNIRKRPFISYR